MNTVTTPATTSMNATRARSRRMRTDAIAHRRTTMPRSTTRVFWTYSSGTVVEFGEVR